MFNQLSFGEAADLYLSVNRALPRLFDDFGEAGVECITDALHLYVTSGAASETSAFDVDFSRIFTYAVRNFTGHDLKPEFSCLTDWSGTNHKHV